MMAQGNMRIIAGSRRGKRLEDCYSSATRPTMDRVRESVFNVLLNCVDFSGAVALDLFAGTGAYGFECFSRGAGEVIFNDFDKDAVRVIGRNCDAVGCKARVFNLDYREALKKLCGKQFDVIFLDPPYDSDFGEMAIDIIFAGRMLKRGGVIVFETEKDDLVFDGFEVKVKRYGRAVIYFLKAM